MEIYSVEINTLIPDPENTRRHSEENLRAIESSLARFGQVLPLVVRCGVVVGGNGTLAAMKRLRFEYVKIVHFEGTATEARALSIILNRSGELAHWDVEALGVDVAALSDLGFTPQDLGFSMAALEDMFPVDGAAYQAPQTKEVTFQATVAPKEPLIQYALIFDDEPQQKRFFAFLKHLEEEYSGKSTAERLDRHIRFLLGL